MYISTINQNAVWWKNCRRNVMCSDLLVYYDYLTADDALPIRIWFTKDKTGDGSTDNFPIPADVIAFDASDIRETMWWVVLSDKNWVTVHAMTTNQTEEKVWEYYILYFRDKGVMQVRLLDSKNAKIYYNWRFARFAHLGGFFFQVKEFTRLFLEEYPKFQLLPCQQYCPFSLLRRKAPQLLLCHTPHCLQLRVIHQRHPWHLSKVSPNGARRLLWYWPTG